MKRLLVLGLLLCCTVAGAESLQGSVIVVIDGDTVLFKPERYTGARAFFKVRLVGIDAPERDQPQGDAATAALQALVLQRRVSLDIVATDIYGRALGRLEVDGRPLDVELVRAGHAWASSRSPRDELRALQDVARRERIGLWQDQAPIPPWVWRRTHPRP